jgi:Tfp pilus assembly protein PilN
LVWEEKMLLESPQDRGKGKERQGWVLAFVSVSVRVLALVRMCL